MKPIIVDLKDISDSTEVYDSKPNRFVPYTIYIICAILAIALIWMYLFRMDIVVKADSVFRGDDDSTAVSCAVTGKITKMSVKDGQYVNEGDELYEVDIENLGSTIEDYKSKLDSVQRRLDMLNAYQKSLDGDNSEFDAMSDNQYYSEFKDRKELLNTSIDAGKEKNKTGEVYDENITVINDSIDKYNEKINKLKDVNEYDENVNEVLRGIFGNEFPKNEKNQSVEENLFSYRNTEEFIEDRFVVDIQYNLELECTVTQNGYRPAKLSEMLRNKVILMPKKQLEFYIKSIENFEKLQPYSIFWKIKNEGEIAEKKDMIRGQLLETNSYVQKEHTDFRGNHYVEAYIVKEGICVAKERIEVPIRENTGL